MRKHFVAGGVAPRKASPWGKLSPKVTDEGAILYPTFPCRRRDLSPFRPPSPVPLGESIAPSSAPVRALGHLPRGEGFGGGSFPIGYPTPFRPIDSPGRAHQQVRAAALKPEGPHPPFRSTDSPGRARLAEFRRPRPAEKINHVLTGSAGLKHSSQPPVCPQGARLQPQFWEGPPTKQAT